MLVDDVTNGLRQLLKEQATASLSHQGIGFEKNIRSLQFSRAEASDLLRIVELWNAFRSTYQGDFPPRCCPACRSTDSRFLFQSFDMHPFHACEKCDTWFVPEVMDDSVINTFFEKVPEAKRLSDNMMTGRDEKTRDTDRDRFNNYFQLLDPLVTGRPQSFRYLDIGCGVGHSIELASELGWDALGVELSEIAVETARARGRNVVLPKEWGSLGPFDMVSLFETLEHVTHPDPLMDQAVKALAPLGFVIITVPNKKNIEVQAIGSRCFHVFGGSENVGHINLFDESGLSVLLRRHGLSLVFTDGQFASDYFQLFGQLFVEDRSPLDIWKGGRIELDLPSVINRMLNNLGPALSTLERALIRSPILIAIACRSEDVSRLQPMIDKMEANRKAELMRLLETV